MGIIRIVATNELFPGKHEPIITKSLFDTVQAVLSGKHVRRVQNHDYLFRRLLNCKLCNYSLIGETQKGHIYYRCHTKDCPTKTIKEETIEAEISMLLARLRFSKDEQACLETKLVACKKDWKDSQVKRLGQLRIDLARSKEKLLKLTDAYIESRLDRTLFEMRHNQLILEMKDIEEKMHLIETGKSDIASEIENFLELCKTAYSQYEMGFSEEKRDIIKNVTSNRLVCRNNLEFTWSFPFQQVAERHSVQCGAPHRDILRTCEDLFILLCSFFEKSQELTF
jgi:hypothetical protein